MPIVNQPYIGFEGPIGAGKTTLAQLLALHLGATLILEDVDGNEFLPDFYANRERWERRRPQKPGISTTDR